MKAFPFARALCLASAAAVLLVASCSDSSDPIAAPEAADAGNDRGENDARTDDGQAQDESDSGAADVQLDSLGKTSSPTMDPPPGNFTCFRRVSLAATPGATIHYTIDKTDPVASSPIYDRPIKVIDGTTEIRAVAIAPGFEPSDVAVGAYAVISNGACVLKPVVFTPKTGTVLGPTNSITLVTESAPVVICYTTNGDDPACSDDGTCASGLTYSAPFSIPVSASPVTVKAIPCTSANMDSSVTSATYTF